MLVEISYLLRKLKLLRFKHPAIKDGFNAQAAIIFVITIDFRLARRAHNIDLGVKENQLLAIVGMILEIKSKYRMICSINLFL